MIYDNKSSINSAFSKIGVKRDLLNDNYIWTSTEKESAEAWEFNGTNGNIFTNTTDMSGKCIPFYQL